MSGKTKRTTGRNNRNNSREDYNSRNDKQNSNNGNAGRQRSNNTRKETAQRKEKEMRDGRSTMNDPQWYANNESLLRDSASFPYSWPLGAELPINDSVLTKNVELMFKSRSVPGIMAIDFVPTIGMSDNLNSPINIAARNIYAFVRHANSGHSNYDAPDLMMYLIALDSAYAMYAKMVRAYGTMMLYTPTNRYYPRALVETMGFDYDDLSANLAQFRYFINQYAYKLSSFCVPAQMTYFTRHIWLNSGIYVDSDSSRAQTYLFNQSAYYVYTATVATGFAAQLSYTPFPTKAMKLADIITIANSVINPLINDEDMNIISGDMLKAFGQENLFQVAPIAEDYVVIPAKDYEVLSQIQNLTIMGSPDTAVSTQPGQGADIVQRLKTDVLNAGLYQVLTFKENNAGAGAASARQALMLDKLVTMWEDNVTPADTMVATRLSNVVTTFGVENSGTSPVYGCDYMGSEFVQQIRIVSYGWKSATEKTWVLSQQSFNSSVFYIDGDQSALYLSVKLLALAQLEAFDFHPVLLVASGKGTISASNKASISGWLVETNNYTLLSAEDLAHMHETALLSEFSVPQMAALSTRPVPSR